jgi:hypothetical protein
MSEIVADPPDTSCYLLFSGPGIEEFQSVDPDPFLPRARDARGRFAKGSSGNRGGRPAAGDSYSGPQGAAMARAQAAGKIELGAIHTYIELFARSFMDLTPHVALIAAVQPNPNGNLYTGPNTEDTPTIDGHQGHLRRIRCEAP